MEPYFKHLKIHYSVKSYVILFELFGYNGSIYYFIDDFKLCASSIINMTLEKSLLMCYLIFSSFSLISVIPCVC